MEFGRTVSYCSSIPCILHHGRKGNTLALWPGSVADSNICPNLISVWWLASLPRSNASLKLCWGCFLLPLPSQLFVHHSKRLRCINCAVEWKCLQSGYYTVCPTRYRTRHFFNNFTINEDIATKFEADYRHIPLHFSHTEPTPVQISLQYLHCC